MSISIECDWCTRPIEADDGYTADEYNRMGFEGDVDDHAYVVMEARFGQGKRGGTTTFGHFHYPDCYHSALRLLRDHGRWSESREAGPEAALLPRWTTDGKLQDRELAARRELDHHARWEIANGQGGIGWLHLSRATFNALMGADVLSITQLERRCADGTLTAVRGVGHKRLEEARAALERYERESAKREAK
jgi:hypothetical protein